MMSSIALRAVASWIPNWGWGGEPQAQELEREVLEQ